MTTSRVAVVAAVVLIAAATLTGCSHRGFDAAPAPASTAVTTPAPVASDPPAAATSPSTSGIASDLNTAQSATSAANGDLNAGEAAQQAGDNP